MKVVFESIVGSLMHGLQVPGSDTDTRFIYLSSLRDMLSPFKNKEKVAVQRNEVTGDTESFEFAKFTKMLSSGNPTCYEVIKSPLFKETPWSNQIKESFPLYHNSLGVLNAHCGYAEAQLNRYLRQYVGIEERPCELDRINDWANLEADSKTTKANFLRRIPKAVVAAHRVLAQGTQLLLTHDFEAVISKYSQRLHNDLMAIKSMSTADIDLKWVSYHLNEIEMKMKSLNNLFDSLSETERNLKPNILAIEEMLLDIYKNQEEIHA